MASKPDPRHQGGTPARHPQPNQPRGRSRARYGALKDARLAGYLASALCNAGCGGRQTTHLVLRHQLECKTCLTVRRRRPDDPAAP